MSTGERTAVLIVDDNLGNRIAFQSLLESLGQTLVLAETGRAAIEEARLREFAVILLDIRMPDLDGLETAALLRKRELTRHTPILFVSAFEATPSFVADARLVGAVDYLFSPVDPELLRLKVAAFVDMHLEQLRRRSAMALLEAENRELRHRVDKLRSDNEDLRTQLDLCSP